MRQPARVLIVLCGFVAAAAHAGVLYKCSDAKGALTIQSDPCPAGSKEIWKRDSAPAAQPTLQQVVANSVQQKNANGSAPAVIAPAAAPSAPPPSGPVVAPVGTDPAAATPPPVAPAIAGAPSAPAEPTIKLSPPPVSTKVNPDCEAAKAFAASVREKIWLDLSQEQMGSLYSWVMNECSHRDDSNDQ